MTKSLENFLINHITNIRHILRLCHYVISIKETSNTKIGADIKVDMIYLTAEIGITPNLKSLYEQKCYEDIIQMLCHELTHIITEELFDYANKLIKDKKDRKELLNKTERITQHTSKWGYRLYQEFLKDNKIDLKTGKCIKK